MPKITIYTTAACPYCLSAKDLLRRKRLDFTEIPVDGDPADRRKMSERAGGSTTVPQIFLGDRHIGGCDELYELERLGKLDVLLVGADHD
ncbi:glutaredoxin 3 [Methylocapsa palsarum]|uniref:Glutaredoxin n=1 Tax=Methylocapsa palsarum TaxID=1612308 RepID=A0A1I4C683_9HYPH|nr:glutaredoxin 3 [Methylocapsa palsarum]SFK75799.1 glutaredoxin 3 [Methylocapsa palsarum]